MIQKAIVRSHYDVQSVAYGAASDMQSASLEKLLALTKPLLDVRAPGLILDVGCGHGQAVQLLSRCGLLDRWSYAGIDLSRAMIGHAQRANPRYVDCFQAGDAEALDFADCTVGGVLANSVLHWLNQPQLNSTPRKAFEEFYRVLAPGGIVATSIAGVGTGQKFVEAYAAVMADVKDSGGDRVDVRKNNPIGLMSLDEAVGFASSVGFQSLHAEFVSEPVRFARAVRYAEAARAYGFDMFLSGVAETSREAIWGRIVDRFQDLAPDVPYVHDQFMIYLLAEKPG